MDTLLRIFLFLSGVVLLALSLALVVFLFFRDSPMLANYIEGDMVTPPDVPVREAALIVIEDALEKREATDQVSLRRYYLQGVQNKFDAMISLDEKEAGVADIVSESAIFDAGQFLQDMEKNGLKEAILTQFRSGAELGFETFLKFENRPLEKERKLSKIEKDEVMAKLFLVADVDANGKLSRSEYVGLHNSMSEAKQFASEMDENSNNFLDKVELRSAKLRYGKL